MKEKEISTSTVEELDKIGLKIENNRNSSDLIKAMEILRSPDDLESNTILTNAQVNALSLMNWASQVYDIEFFKHYVTLFPRYRISGDDGRGRKELIEIAKAIQQEKLEDNKRLTELLRR